MLGGQEQMRPGAAWTSAPWTELREQMACSDKEPTRQSISCTVVQLFVRFFPSIQEVQGLKQQVSGLESKPKPQGH